MSSALILNQYMASPSDKEKIPGSSGDSGPELNPGALDPLQSLFSKPSRPSAPVPPPLAIPLPSDAPKVSPPAIPLPPVILPKISTPAAAEPSTAATPSVPPPVVITPKNEPPAAPVSPPSSATAPASVPAAVPPVSSEKKKSEEPVKSEAEKASKPDSKETPAPAKTTFEPLSRKPAPLLSRRNKDQDKEKEKKPTETGEAKRPGPAAAHPGIDASRKKAAPLLSRQKSEKAAQAVAAPSTPSPAPVALPSSGTGTGVQRPKPAWKKIALRVLIIVLIPLLGTATYYSLRETRLEGRIAHASDFSLNNEAFLVRDFRNDLTALQEEIQLSRDPIRQSLQDKQTLVNRVKSDISAREERLHLLNQEIASAQGESAGIIDQAKKQGQAVWDEKGKQLDDEYNQKKKDFSKQIQDRAAALKLPLAAPAPEYDSPEVWVNAFRLSLYDAPKTVKAVSEREWAEKLLEDWRAYEKQWQGQIQKIRQQVEDIDAVPGPRIEKINDRVKDLQTRIEETKAEIEPLQAEMEGYQKDIADLQAQDAAIYQRFYNQLVQVPNGNINYRIPLEANGRFSWRHIEQNSSFPPGSYLLWIRAQKKGEEYWTLIPFTLYPYVRTEVSIEPAAFISVRELLQ